MEDLQPITPVNFFQLAFDCHYLPPSATFPRLKKKSASKYQLPDTTTLCNEEHFADAAMGWSEEGIEFLFTVGKPFEQSFYPDIIKGDSVEVFIDTRDVKTSGYNTRFCHHFFFLPEAVEGYQIGEITHFRTEDAHDLCDSGELKVIGTVKKSEYCIHSFIPRTCLFGYDPGQFDRMGFTYRVNRPRWVSQHLSVVTEDYKLEQQPSLWSQVRLRK